MSDTGIDAQTPGSTGTVTALERGITILRCFDDHVVTLSNAELSQLTGIPRPTVTRLAATLVAAGMLRQDRETERFALAAGVVSLARAFLAHVDVRSVARPYMNELANRLGGSVYLAVRDGLDMVLIEIARSRGSVLRSSHELGTRIAVGKSALGRACLSGIEQSDPATHQYLLEEMARLYGGDWPGLEAKLNAARADFRAYGYCLSLGEQHPEIHSVGVPLAIGHAEPMAINFGGPAFTFTEAHLRDAAAPALIEVAKTIRRETGSE